ncbi:PCYCGC motif-containing (lipo)protein [Sediminibacillus massiliensis]|uniref:PCYCGC motif-containing (lipo)protein n=1 Tax=Sediminibacillus massiliensis TaxID=1926277 RepID=UPI0009883939|nr:PCYCGC motif-containing (lipo)protein [Sediminibacillus massiliensis]
MKRIYFSLLIVLIIVLTACSSNTESQKQEKLAPNHEQTEGIEVLPSFLDQSSQDMRNVYLAVAQQKELLEQIPCYCGCGDEKIGHRDNYDCFVFDNDKNGEVIWDSHGINCQVCIDTAVYSINEYQKGTDIGEIRATIDETYQQDYPAPTPTPGV